jgi:hypothetical protein
MQQKKRAGAGLAGPEIKIDCIAAVYVQEL